MTTIWRKTHFHTYTPYTHYTHILHIHFAHAFDTHTHLHTPAHIHTQTLHSGLKTRGHGSWFENWGVAGAKSSTDGGT